MAFGYKAHVGVDKDSGLAHTVEVTSAHVHDVATVPKLLPSMVYGDGGYLEAEKREDAVTENKSGKRIRYKLNRRPSQIKKGSARAKVEHVFAVVKGRLRYRKTRYRDLQKQTAKLNMLFALASLILAADQVWRSDLGCHRK